MPDNQLLHSILSGSLGTALRHSTSFPRRSTAILGEGDCDTIACMADAIAGAQHGFESLPCNLLDRLENKGYIEELTKKFYELIFGGGSRK